MDRRAFLLSTLFAPIAATFTPAPELSILSWKARREYGFESFPLEPLTAETMKKAWKDLADAAFEARQHDADLIFNNFP